MQRQDWLLQRIEELAKFLAAAMGQSDATEQTEAKFEELSGMTLPLLRSLAPAVAVRMLTVRYGSFQLENAFIAWKLLETLADPALERHREALRSALLTEAGPETLSQLEATLAKA